MTPALARRAAAAVRTGKGTGALLYSGAAILGVLAVVAALAPVLAPYNPRKLTGAALEQPSARHLLGTNNLGQDIASQLIWGARSSLTLATAAAGLAATLGLVLGVGSALLGGLVDTLVMRVVDMFMALPIVPLLLLIGSLAGDNRLVVVIVLGLLGWPAIARVTRSQALSLRQRGYVQAARGFGGDVIYVVRRHLAPALGPVVVSSFVTFAGAVVVLDAFLASLGVGNPAGVNWGMVLNQAIRHPGLYYSPLWTWWVLPAGMAITLTALGFAFVGVGLEARFNPHRSR